MATSSFTRKIIVTGKEATDMVIDAITSDTSKNNDYKQTEKFLDENKKREDELLKKFAFHYKK